MTGRMLAPPRPAPKPATGDTAGLSRAEARSILNRDLAQQCSSPWSDEDSLMSAGYRPAQWCFPKLLGSLLIWTMLLGGLAWTMVRWL